MAKEGNRSMSTSGMIGEEIDKQLASASAALRNITGADASAERKAIASARCPRRAWALCGGTLHGGPRCAIRHIQRRTCSGCPLQTAYSLEGMADEMLMAAREQGYFEDPDTAEPLRWLETCNAQVEGLRGGAGVHAGPAA